MFRVLILLMCVLSSFSQIEYSIQRINHTITIDGDVTGEEWSMLKPLPLTVASPVFKAEPTEKTEIYVAYDNEYFYAAARMYDKNPELININSLTRDNWASDDGFAIILDTFNDNQNALVFITTPTGVRIDWAVFNDAQSQNGEPFNSSWNTFWDSEAIVTEEGWFAEIRIPLSSLKFSTSKGIADMGMLAFRYIPRKNEAQNFPVVSPEHNWGFLKPSIAHKIQLKDVESKNPIYIKPYVLGGLSQEWIENDANTAYEKETDWTKELGLDVKLNLSNDLTLDLTVNTDFAQVESDDAQVNLSQFDLFRPEKRLFFQERASLFSFSTGGPTQLFYSRQIGFSDTGAVRILGGARLIGRLGDWDVGVINMQTEKSILLPAENFGVLRIKRPIINPYSFIGAILTSRLGTSGEYNLAFGIDTEIRFGLTDNYLSINLAKTSDDDPEYQKGNFLDKTRIRMSLGSRDRDGLGYSLFLSHSGEFYNPEMGFVRSENFKGIGARLSYGSIYGEESFLQTQTNLVFNYSEFSNVDGRLQQGFANLNWQMETKTSRQIHFQAELQRERLDEELELPEDNVVPIGFYEYLQFEFRYQSPFGRSFRYGIEIGGGEFYDGKLLKISLNPSWSVSRHLELNLNLEYNKANFDDRKQSFSTSVVRLKTGYALNRVVSASSFIQFNSADHQVTMNARLRVNPSEGNDFYLVYDEAFNNDRMREIPFLPKTQNRTILLKYDYTFIY